MGVNAVYQGKSIRPAPRLASTRGARTHIRLRAGRSNAHCGPDIDRLSLRIRRRRAVQDHFRQGCNRIRRATSHRSVQDMIPVMLRSFLDISRQYFRPTKSVIRRPSPLRRTVFWRTPFFSAQAAEEILAQWEAVNIPADAFSSKRPRHVLTSVELKHDGRIFIPKIYTSRKIGQNIAALVFSEAERNSATLAHLHENGVTVPVPVGVLNTYTWGYLTDSILFQERLPRACVPYKHFQTGLKDIPADTRLEFFRQLGASLAKVHVLGVYTEDTDQNLMVEVLDNGRFTFHYFDFDNVYPWRYPTYRRTEHAIRHFISPTRYPCTRDELLAFLTAYTTTRGRTDWLDAFVGVIRAKRPHLFDSPAG